mgnify:CR=1 FL=1
MSSNFDERSDWGYNPVKERYICPVCSKKCTAVITYPMREVRCYAPRVRPNRQKGQTRMIACDNLMIKREVSV